MKQLPEARFVIQEASHLVLKVSILIQCKQPCSKGQLRLGCQQSHLRCNLPLGYSNVMQDGSNLILEAYIFI